MTGRWMIRPRMSRVLPGVAVLLVLAGCVASPRPPQAGLSPDEQLLRRQSERIAPTVVQGTAFGATVGAGLGLLYSLFSKADSDQTARNVVVGAGIGAVAGGVDGYLVAKRREWHASEIARLESMTSDLREENRRLADLVATSDRVVQENGRQLATLRQDVAARRVSVQEAGRQIGIVAGNRDRIAGVVAEMERKREQYRHAAGAMRNVADTTDYDAEIVRLSGQIERLKRDIVRLDEELAVTRIG